MLSKIIFVGAMCVSFTIMKHKKQNYTATWYDTSRHPKVHRPHSTAAFNEYPKGTMLVVVNKNNGKSDTVEVTDRHHAGKYHIDLSKTSFNKIANLKQGRISVSIKRLN